MGKWSNNEILNYPCFHFPCKNILEFTSVCPNSEDREEALDIDLNIFLCVIFFQIFFLTLDSPHRSHSLTCRGRIPAAGSFGEQDPFFAESFNCEKEEVHNSSHLISIQGSSGAVTIQRRPPWGQSTVNIETEKRKRIFKCLDNAWHRLVF